MRITLRKFLPLLLLPLFTKTCAFAQGSTATRTALSELPSEEKFDLLITSLKESGKTTKVGSATKQYTVLGVAGAAPASLDVATIQRVAAEDGLLETFGAVFKAYGSFADGGSTAVPAAQSGFQTQLMATINFESEHYGYIKALKNAREHQPDFSFGGAIGLYPAMVMENLTVNSGTIAQPNNRPMFQDAVHWHLGPNMNIPVFSHGEASVYADYGQNILVDSVTSFKQGDLTVTATPVANDLGRAAFFGEFGLQMKLFGVSVDQAHTDKTSNLLPKFMFAAGFRKDDRFAKRGDLSAFESPDRRVFFRTLVSLSKILKWDDDGKPAPPASLDFGVDYERAATGARNSIPSGTRVIVSAGLDIMKLFRPQKGSN